MSAQGMDGPQGVPIAARILGAGLTCFALVFGAGFVLGPVRVLWLVPQVGTRTAELLEMPLMFAVILLASRWLHGGLLQRLGTRPRLLVGLFALACTLAAEIAVGMAMRDMSLPEVLADRDPVSGTAYCLLLVVFGLAPWWHGRTAANPR